MTWETIAAAATSTIIDVLGETATYTPQIGAVATVTIQFVRDPIFFETEEGQMLSFDARAFGKAADFASAREDDELRINSTLYRIATVEPDGEGAIELKLRKVS